MFSLGVMRMLKLNKTEGVERMTDIQELIFKKLELIETKQDKFNDKLDTFITKADCSKNQETCLSKISALNQAQKAEVSVKKITAVGGVVTGTIAASTALIIAIVKAF
jgi:hypothetical protein